MPPYRRNSKSFSQFRESGMILNDLPTSYFTFLKKKRILVSTSKNMQSSFFWTVARIVALVLSNLWLFPLPLTMKTLLFVTAFSKITGASISSDVDRIMKMVFSLSFLHVWQRVLLSKLILHQPFWDLQ